MNHLIRIFCNIDDYCKEYRNTVPFASMSLSEIITIVVNFYNSKFRDFKSYCIIMIIGVLNQGLFYILLFRISLLYIF
jgi:hypothetical protein